MYANFAKCVRPAAIVAAVLSVILGGCAAEPKKPDSKELATKRWNAARASVLMSLARDQFQSGNFDKCRQTLDEALRLTPDNAPLRVLSAKLLIEKGQLEAAERDLKLARERTPNDGEAYYLSGIVYQRWQKPQAAYDLYRKASDKSPAELAYVLAQAEMLVAMDRTPDALALLQEKVDYFEHSGTIRDAVGQLLSQMGKTDEALAMFRQAAILSEKDLGVRERLAKALFAHKDYREAADAFERLLQDASLASRADLFIILGQCQLEIGRSREARNTFETASNLEPYSATAWRGLGRAALETGDLKRSELSLAKSIRYDAEQAQSHLLLGYLRVKQERYEDALESFEHASSLDRKDTVCLCMIGYVYEKLRRPSDAGQYYARALRLRPGDELASKLMAGVDLHD